MAASKHADLELLRHVAATIAPHVHRTPIIVSRTLSKLVGCTVLLKAELFQKTGSYKPRGMLWALHVMPESLRRQGVITFSAGNAAQGLAYAGALHGVPVTVIMPSTASETKAAATRDYGATVILHGTPSECLQHCRQVSEREGLRFVSSYDDIDLMTGHATMGLEILDDFPAADAIFVGVGGGGMAGGLAIAATAIDHSVRLFGVEPFGAAAMAQSVSAGHALQLPSVATIADGLAAPGAGTHCFDLVNSRFEMIDLVTDEAIVDAMKLLMSRCKLFAEPAGSAALAGLLARAGQFRKTDVVVCVISGGNVDFDRLRALI
jgi:threonine dehydratase